MKKYIIFLAINLFLFSCDEYPGGDENASLEDQLIGTWNNYVYSDSILTLSRENKLSDNEYGITFNADGSIEEQANAGFCGTEPISYALYEGNYEFLSDSVIEITSSFWGGTALRQWRILSVDKNEMRYITLKEEYPFEE